MPSPISAPSTIILPTWVVRVTLVVKNTTDCLAYALTQTSQWEQFWKQQKTPADVLTPQRLPPLMRRSFGQIDPGLVFRIPDGHYILGTAYAAVAKKDGSLDQFLKILDTALRFHQLTLHPEFSPFRESLSKTLRPSSP